MTEIKLLDPAEYFTNPRHSTLFEDIQRDWYLARWAMGWERGVSARDMIRMGYSAMEIYRAKKDHPPCQSPEQRRAEDWSFLADKPL